LYYMYRAFLLSFFYRALRQSADVSADAGLLSDKAGMLGETIRGGNLRFAAINMWH
jgi:hypothetical protein